MILVPFHEGFRDNQIRVQPVEHAAIHCLLQTPVVFGLSLLPVTTENTHWMGRTKDMYSDLFRIWGRDGQRPWRGPVPKRSVFECQDIQGDLRGSEQSKENTT